MLELLVPKKTLMKDCRKKLILCAVLLSVLQISFAQSSDLKEDYRFKDLNGFTKFVWHEFSQKVQKDTTCIRGIVSIELNLNQDKSFDSTSISPGLPEHLEASLYEIVNASNVYWKDYFETSGEPVPTETIVQLVYFDIQSHCRTNGYQPTNSFGPSVFSLFRDKDSPREGFYGFWNSSEMPLKALMLGPAIFYVSPGFTDLNPAANKD